jgi:AAHS family 4-hydroxybenzoate transporter-like MFS transporter
MAEQAATGRTLDVAEFLRGLKITPFHRWLIFLSCMVTFFDGLDFALVSATLPYIRDEMGLTPTMMGLVSSAAFLGQMIGSLAGSYLADVVGRRPVILLCTVLGAIFTFVTGYADSPDMLIGLRLLGGLAIGGLLAPAWSLNVEAMPASLRATSVTIIMLGFSLGGGAASQVSNFIAPSYGWEGVFFVCGALTFALAIGLQFTLPESARWMTAKGRPIDKIMPLLNRFEPGVADKGYARLVLSDEKKVSGVSPWAKTFQLFKGPLVWITPIIWATYFCSSFAIYIKASFGLLFLEKLGLSVTFANNLIFIGGTIGAVGAIFVMAFVERRGPIWIAIAPLIGIPLALLIGSGLILDGPYFIPTIILGSIMIGVGHASVISITTIYYPSAVRSTGGGWASFMAKFAAVAAPNVGAAYFLADRASVLKGYNFTALCLAGVVVGILALTFFARRLSKTPIEPEPETVFA